MKNLFRSIQNWIDQYDDTIGNLSFKEAIYTHASSLSSLTTFLTSMQGGNDIYLHYPGLSQTVLYPLCQSLGIPTPRQTFNDTACLLLHRWIITHNASETDLISVILKTLRSAGSVANPLSFSDPLYTSVQTVLTTAPLDATVEGIIKGLPYTALIIGLRQLTPQNSVITTLIDTIVRSPSTIPAIDHSLGSQKEILALRALATDIYFGPQEKEPYPFFLASQDRSIEGVKAALQAWAAALPDSAYGTYARSVTQGNFDNALTLSELETFANTTLLIWNEKDVYMYVGQGWETGYPTSSEFTPLPPSQIDTWYLETTTYATTTPEGHTLFLALAEQWYDYGRDETQLSIPPSITAWAAGQSLTGLTPEEQATFCVLTGRISPTPPPEELTTAYLIVEVTNWMGSDPSRQAAGRALLALIPTTGSLFILTEAEINLIIRIHGIRLSKADQAYLRSLEGAYIITSPLL